jgi:hypothetical protein
LNRRATAFGLLLAGGVIGAAVFAVAGGDGDDPAAGPATTTSTTKPLNAVAKRLVDRLTDARDRDLHIVYSGALGTEGGKVTVEVWWKGALARQSLIAESPQEGRQETSGFVLEGTNVVCQRTQEVDWKCQRAPSTATAGGRSASIIDALVAQLGGKDVTTAKAKVGDVDADCYTIDPATTDSLCVREDGVPVKLAFGGTELVATTIETKVNSAVFEPPATVEDPPVTAGTTSTTVP